MSAVQNNEVSCSICGRLFTRRKNLYRHMRKFHPNYPSKTEFRYKTACCACDLYCKSIFALHTHIGKDHPEIQLSFEKKIFYCTEDFDEWKSTVEKSIGTRFIKHRPDLILSDGRVANHLFCERSGFYQPKKNRKRNSMGTKKIGKTCPAHILYRKLEIDEAIEIEVQYQSLHVGHSIQIQLPTANDDKVISGQPSSPEVPSSVVSTSSRIENTDNSSGAKRKECSEKIICDNSTKDATSLLSLTLSVNLFVNKLQSTENNPVLIYKPGGTVFLEYPSISKDAILLFLMNNVQLKLVELYGNNGIMVDFACDVDTQDFQLVTVTVTDYNNEIFPVALLLLTEPSVEAFRLFLIKVKVMIPNLNPSLLMSDDIGQFNEAFNAVFGGTALYFLCPCDVKQRWQKFLNSGVKETMVQDNVLEDFMQLMQLTSSASFESTLNNYIKKYSVCEKTKIFWEYFTNFYINRIGQWAYIYRTELQIDIGKKLELWHKEMGCIKISCGVVDIVASVLNLAAKKLIACLTSESNKLGSCFIDICNRHNKSKLLSVECVTVTKPKNSWVVRCDVDTADGIITEKYSVQYERDCKCDIWCYECAACVHQFSCTCLDYSVNLMMCEHIHLICQHFNTRTVDANEEILMNITWLHEDSVFGASDDAAIPTVPNTDDQKDAVISDLQSLVMKCQAFETTVEELLVIKEGVKDIKSKLFTIAADRILRDIGM